MRSKSSMRSKWTILLLSLVCISFNACLKKAKNTSSHSGSVSEELNKSLDLSAALTAKPAAIISVTAHLDLEFNTELIPAHLRGQSLNQNPFVFTPNIEGKAEWLDQRSVRFTPDAPLVAGQKYQAIFYGKIALGPQKNVNDLSFEFKVAEQEVLELEGEFVPDAEANKTHYEGTVSFAQKVDLNQLQKDLEIQLEKQEIEFHLQATDDAARVRIISNGIDRVAPSRSVRFTLPKAYSVGAPSWQQNVILPGKELFRVLAGEENSDPESGDLGYNIRLSEPIMEGLDLSGFIQISPEVEFKAQIQGKYIKLRGKFEPGQSYAATLVGGFPSAYKNKLPESVVIPMTFTNHLPEIKWFSDGIFLPTENHSKLQMKSMNVSKIHVEVREVFSGNLGFFLQNNNAGKEGSRRSYQSEDDEGDSYSASEHFQDLERVGKTIYKKDFELKPNRNKWLKSELNLEPIFASRKKNARGAYIMHVTFTQNDLAGKCIDNLDSLENGGLYFESKGYYRNPCNEGYYYNNGEAQKLILLSNTALTLKKTEDGFHVYATNVLDAKPVSGLKLNLYSYQNQIINNATTDGDGHVFFTSPLSEDSVHTGEKLTPDRAFYIRGEQDQGLALIKLDHSSWETSHFETDGAIVGKNGMDAFIYTDRGVHRPGDTVQLSAIFRVNREPPPANQNIALQLLNAKGQKVFETRASSGTNGHVNFSLPTNASDPTGAWTATLELADQVFEKQLKIEMVKPNRLKINIETPEKITSTSKGAVQINAAIDVKYLFGTPASGLNLKANITVTKKTKEFSRYPGFIFEHPLLKFSELNEIIENKTLDAQGKFQLQHSLHSSVNAPSGLQSKIKITVFEKGGSFTEQNHRVDIDPYTAYVGIKNQVKSRYLQQGENLKVPIIALNTNGKPLPGRRIKLKVYTNSHYWWWEYDGNDKKDFRKMAKTYLIHEEVLVSETKPLIAKIKMEDEGEHLIEITDEVSGHSTGFFVYASEWGGKASADKKEQNDVEIHLDKNIYVPGDDGEISFKSPGSGMALVSYEQGDKVLKSEWVTTKSGKTKVPFHVTENMLPNFYVSVSLIQPHNQSKNDLPMRLYGIKPVYVEDPEAHLEVSLEMPKEIRPDKDFTVKIQSNSKNSATYTLAVVDEGLLDLTSFVTPNPFTYFFKKIGLSVSTLDNFEDFMGSLLPDMDRYFSIGGDEDQRSKRTGADQNRRFKAVSLFQGPTTIKAGETKAITLHMPNYVGSVRAMLVACSNHGYASREVTTPVKQPLMILSTVPRVIAPGDQFNVPVSVFSMDANLHSAVVNMLAPKNMVVNGESQQSVTFAKPGETDIAFSLTAGKNLGVSPIKITAQGQVGNKTETTEDITELNVQSPFPFYTRVTDTSVIAGQTISLQPEKWGIEGSNSAYLICSRLPDIQAQKKLKDLIQYPYGCLEQTVSAIFPQLHLDGLVYLNQDEKNAITANINEGIKKIAKFQIPGNGYSLWPSSPGSHFTYDNWATSYAVHFLLEAKSLGYNVPNSLLEGWQNFSESETNSNGRTIDRYKTYRLFLLSLSGKPNMGMMNLIRENDLKDLDPLAKKLLAAAYFLAGKKVDAKAIEDKVFTEITRYREMDGTYGSDLRDQAFVAYLDMLMDEPKDGLDRLKSVIKEFQNGYGWYSTQEVGMALMALGSYYQKYPYQGGALSFDLNIEGEKTKTLEIKKSELRIPLPKIYGKKVSITTNSKSPVYISLMEEGIPLENKIKDESKGLTLTRNFYDEQGRPMQLSDIRKDKSFWVMYQITNISGRDLNGLALSSIFPAGWEIISQRVGDADLPEWVKNLSPESGNYMDIRDDRVNWFFGLARGGRMNFMTKLNASFGGDYVLPPIVTEAMYSPEFYAHITGGRVQVK